MSKETDSTTESEQPRISEDRRKTAMPYDQDLRLTLAESRVDAALLHSRATGNHDDSVD
ncbi:hypothetical protein [Amycolatopsis sp. H20-H5]|uniref:hypothetical protein n=1 Tax=Amycolatopsis sp. H20-H5 TaxID=3046309 RepID=UPI002DBF6AA1|nr:hypothetical protein [Amycolatopsis sp. H20-H5]MEC3975558.1 hypothetical protein [Amycolatopsis sp. H20-H5]